MASNAEAKCNELIIGGVNVKFPCKPYPSQLQMMSKIIKGLQTSEHCLLESPTGSGKSLALLCSALAWQENVRQKIAKENFSCENSSDTTTSEHANCSTESVNDFEITVNETTKHSSKETKEKNNKVPTIWFGTRTHKQIAQITRELSRTAYKKVNMTILSSREHSCIHPLNAKSKNKNDGCRDLLKGTHVDLPGTRCSYYQNIHRMRTHVNLYSCGLTSAWDLEDLVKLGKRIRACPYYSTRELKSTASIIFCPYNYLIDPGIRNQMGINTSGQVIIFDEAHNIEDSARSAASGSVNELELINTIADLDHLVADGIKIEQHQSLHLLCVKIGRWMQENCNKLDETAYDTWSKVWHGQDFISCLSEWGITADTLPVLQKNYKEVVEIDNDEESEDQDIKMLHSSSQALLGGLFHVLSYLLFAEQKFCKDYRVAIIRHAEYGVPPPKRTREGWISLSKRASKYFSVDLHFWCLNPAVAFSDLASTHCIILSSGTLSPMSSFTSELGVSFPIKLEASHVIDDSQVWVGTIGCGPNGQPLQATYQNTNGLNFQDELGNVILSICNIVPFGVLCFFSSYKMIEKLTERWQNTGLWNEISAKKTILSEPHGSNKTNFEEVMQSFYQCISSAHDGITGALLLAVCRGKISEGLDFSNNNARAVITVGIPFPNFKDRQVELKRKYNDEYCKSRGLLSGSDWYEIQAFRALNQALGRCIRHKNDWGALIIIDDRFCKNPHKYCKGLSKWVRQKVKSFPNFQCVTESLNHFCHTQGNDTASTLLEKKSTSNINSFSTMCKSSFVSNDDSSAFTNTITEVDCVFDNKRHIFSAETLQNNAATFFGQYTFAKIASTDSKPKEVSSDSKPVINSTDVDDILLIPSTPKKSNQVIVIPESPESMRVDDVQLMHMSSSKEKQHSTNKKMTLAQQLSKSCKQSLLFEDGALEKHNHTSSFGVEIKDIKSATTTLSKRKEKFDDSAKLALSPQLAKKHKQCSLVNANKAERNDSTNYSNISVEDNSQEFFAPRTRKRRSLKASRRELTNADTKHNKSCTVKHIVKCQSCQAELFSSLKEFKVTTNEFTFVQNRFSDTMQLYDCTKLPAENKLKKAITTTDSYGVILDTVWCETDQLAWQVYLCSNCQLPIVIHPVNSLQHAGYYILSLNATVT